MQQSGSESSVESHCIDTYFISTNRIKLYLVLFHMSPDRICAGQAIGSKRNTSNSHQNLRDHSRQPNYCDNEYPRIEWKNGPAETGSIGHNPRAE